MKSHTPPDLNKIMNPDCGNCENKDQRDTSNGLCNSVTSVYDNLPVRCVGEWAYDKIYFLERYVGIVGNGMKYKWDGRIDYFEICSGPGRCVCRESGNEMDGTAIAVTKNEFFKHYRMATFFDISQPVVDTLNKRLNNLGLLHYKAQAKIGDFTRPDELAAAVLQRSSDGLALVFIDPTDCGVPFDTIRALKKALPHADFIISIMLGVDANRHLVRSVLDPDSNVRKKYEVFLGSPDFFECERNIEYAKIGNNRALRIAFRETYMNSMRTLGFKYFETEKVRHYYELLFSSAHETGLKFWHQAQNIKPNQQATFDFEI